MTFRLRWPVIFSVLFLLAAFLLVIFDSDPSWPLLASLLTGSVVWAILSSSEE